MIVAVIGSGNIATHLAGFFHARGHVIRQVYSRTPEHAAALAKAVSAQPIHSLSELDPVVDLILIAVNDDAIPDVVRQIPLQTQAVVVHTSGSTSLDVLEAFRHHGVIYPPQSLNKHIAAHLEAVPFAVEGSSEVVAQSLWSLMVKMAPKSFLCSSRQRLALHVASVFANNFANALYRISYDILQQENLDFELIKTLVLETAQKVQNHAPGQVQTGPAVRNDYKTINTHLKFLSNTPELAEIYQQLTDFIIKSRQKD